MTHILYINLRFRQTLILRPSALCLKNLRSGAGKFAYFAVCGNTYIPCKDKGDSFGALLTDLSKAFDCLSHELLTGIIAAYDFSRSALNLIYTYLFDRIQRTKISIFYSSWQDILSSIPQGSILGPLLLNIFLCDLFLMINNIDFASYADDNTPYTTDESAEKIID